MSGKASSFKAAAVEAVVFGVVQGVGFRPFIYRLAHKLGYTGWASNIGFGVKIHLESADATKLSDFNDFFDALKNQKPPLAQIEDISIHPVPVQNLKAFTIQKSRPGKSFVFISPDIALCSACSTEMMSPTDRRHLYPFINCTDCGPRYTIVKSLPYDRAQTTMASFEMCDDCRKEYTDPFNRRYHAQPVACPACGPHISLKNAKTGKKIRGGIKEAASLIKAGKILAVKGLGGFHLICDALNPDAVAHLRAIKERKTKPLALMARDLAVIQHCAHISAAEKRELLSARRPIVLLRKKTDIPGIAPHLNEMGFMLPYTPLHALLLEETDLIVATSSNKKDSPIMKDEDESGGIASLCDTILTHNRPIHMRADDSVMKIASGNPLFLRRARGYVPYPQKVPTELATPLQILALGGELKDTVSVYKNGYIITSQFLGDLDEYQNFRYFEETIHHLTRLFSIEPDVVVTDLHPDFHTTLYARKSGLPHLQVQHHFAHVLAVMLEHGIPPGKKVIGVSFDGYGYGEDSTAWGGEFLIADYTGCERLAHFKPVPLPGGDLAAKQPWRMALAYLWDAFEEDFEEVSKASNFLTQMKTLPKKNVQGVLEMIRRSINSPLTSSCGRLFDAVSFLVGLAPLQVEFEAEAPMRLESAASDNTSKSYDFSFFETQNSLQISFAPTIRKIIHDLVLRVPVPEISAKFHNTLAQAVLSTAQRVQKIQSIDTVVLSGGVFLNKRLLETAQILLEKKGFHVLRPVQYSPNDESLSIGQIAYALSKLNTKSCVPSPLFGFNFYPTNKQKDDIDKLCHQPACKAENNKAGHPPE